MVKGTNVGLSIQEFIRRLYDSVNVLILTQQKFYSFNNLLGIHPTVNDGIVHGVTHG